MSELSERWIAAVAALDGDPMAAARSACDLAARYGEPHRHYHTAAHITAVLADLTWLTAALGCTAAERAQADLAACAHDVVYAGVAGKDEARSADWATAALHECGVAAVDVARVAAVIRATADHVADPDDRVAQALFDADLGILAADPADYARYVAAVRAEYAHLPDAAWHAGRGAVLQTLLARSALFGTEPARMRYEAPARANLRTECARLAARVTSQE